MFTPLLGEMIRFDEHIFQIGWHHQLENNYPLPKFEIDATTGIL